MNKANKFIFFILLTALCCFLTALCINNIELINEIYKIIIYIIIGLIFIGSILLNIFNKISLFRLSVTLIIFSLFFSSLFLLLIKTGFWNNISTIDRMKDYIESKGIFSGIVFCLIQFLQVVAIPIPGIVIVSAGTILFGPVWGSILSYLGIVSGSIFAFIIGRKFGYKLIVWIVGDKQLNKTLKLIKGKDKVMFTIIFLLPFFPDDILCFVAGFTTMSLGFFTVMAMTTRIVTILVTVIFTEFIRILFFSESIWGYIVLAVLTILLALIFLLTIKYGDKIQSFFENKIKNKFKNKKDLTNKG